MAKEKTNMHSITHDGLRRGDGVRNPDISQVPSEVAARLYYGMVRLRRCEEALLREYHPADEIRCPVHFCIGQEAVSASLAVLLRADDYVFSHHRSHGYYLGKNAPLRALFAELYGKSTGASGGKAGSQDISHPESRFYSGAILCGAVGIAVGTAFAEKTKGSDIVVIAGFGEAATDEGVFWEAVNYAALKQLPMVFVCENNRYSTFSPQLNRHVADNIHDRVAAFGVPSEAIFGNDVIQVHQRLEGAIQRARQQQGPTFIEAYTYRWNGHVGPESDDHVGYRSAEEIAFWKSHCPIRLLEEALEEAGLMYRPGRQAVANEVDDEIAEAFSFAKASPYPKHADWQACNYSTRTPRADELLRDLEEGVFDQYQAETVPGPY